MIKPSDGAVSESQMMEGLPLIPWRTPLMVSVNSRAEGTLERLACRICIAKHGLHAHLVESLPRTQVEFDKHMAERHPVT